MPDYYALPYRTLTHLAKHNHALPRRTLPDPAKPSHATMPNPATPDHAQPRLAKLHRTTLLSLTVLYRAQPNLAQHHITVPCY